MRSVWSLTVVYSLVRVQFKVLNTVNDQLLSNVTVGFIMEPDDVWHVHSVVPLKSLAYGKTGSCYVCLKHIGDGTFPVVQLANEVRTFVSLCVWNLVIVHRVSDVLCSLFSSSSRFMRSTHRMVKPTKTYVVYLERTLGVVSGIKTQTD